MKPVSINSRFVVAACLLLLTPLPGQAQVETEPFVEVVADTVYDGVYGWMHAWDDGDGAPETYGLTAYGRDGMTGTEVWGWYRVNVLAYTVEEWVEGQWVPIPIEAVYGPVQTFDGADCRNKADIERAMGRRFRDSVRDAVVNGVVGFFTGGPGHAIIGYVGTMTLHLWWNTTALNLACREVWRPRR